MYIRLVVAKIDRHSNQQQGVFTAAYALLDSGELSEADHDELWAHLRWFSSHLPVPQRFDSDRAIFWFKSDAGEVTRRIWELVHALRRNELQVDLIRTRRPGYILYEDRFQIGAIPFHDTA
jgi:hypothetical protein